ncbi:MAG TPA: type II toxin-antitoxin system RelE/ParE family toxin [Allosphingosinicella sp.]|nr:type II toxin-antitoxin system RelE/ParE family toxin [Allosphingosinicella sp.]
MPPGEVAIRVRFSKPAIADLKRIADWIGDRSDEEVGEAYVRRIEAHCRRLSDFPRRGRMREEFGSGVRSTAFERRATILYRIDGDVVIIDTVLYAGRERASTPPPSEAPR